MGTLLWGPMGPPDDRESLLCAGALMAYDMLFTGEAIEVVDTPEGRKPKNSTVAKRFEAITQYWGGSNFGTMERGGKQYVVVLLPMRNGGVPQELKDKLTTD